MTQAKKKGWGNTLSKKLARAAEKKFLILAQDVRILADWLHDDILSLAGPELTTRRALFNFVVDELITLEPLCPHRIRPVRRALQNQREGLLAFVSVLDAKLATIRERYEVSPHLVQAVCELLGLPEDSPLRWQREDTLRRHLTGKFFDVQHAVSEAMATTPRTSSVGNDATHQFRH